MGFEPTVRYTDRTPVFQTGTFGRSVIPPSRVRTVPNVSTVEADDLAVTLDHVVGTADPTHNADGGDRTRSILLGREAL